MGSVSSQEIRVREGDMTAEAEVGVMRSPAKECRRPPGAGKGKRRDCPEAHGPADALNSVIKPTGDLDLQSSKRISSCC